MQHSVRRFPQETVGFTAVKKGQILRIVDLEGNQAADTFFFNANDVSERYSAQDTIREQAPSI